MSNVLVTGATGFVGSVLVKDLASNGFRVSAPGLGEPKLPLESTTESDWRDRLRGIELVVHLAARAHVFSDRAKDPAAEYRRINVEGSLRLLRAAAASGVRRFVFLSSIGVLGNETSTHAYSDDDVPYPKEPYAVSKLEAERCTRDVCGDGRMEFVIVRPPLVCGVGAKGNFRRILQLANSELPLPFASVRSERSFVGVRDLSEFLLITLTHERAANQAFVIGDPDAISLPCLIRLIRQAMGRPERLFSCPAQALTLMAYLARRSSEMQRLTGSLVVDSSRAIRLLGWRPEVGIKRELAAMAAAHVARKKT